jgi:hypothetical protein
MVALAGIGCASAGRKDDVAPPPVQQTTRITTTGAAGMATMGSNDLTLTSEANVGIATLAAPVDKVWEALAPVYQSLGIEVSTLDTPRRTIGNPSLKVRRRLGTVTLTKYIDCGSTQGTQSAETYEIVLNIHTQLQSQSPNSTIVRTTFQSAGRPVSLSTEYRTCASTGALEAKIAELLRNRLGM